MTKNPGSTEEILSATLDRLHDLYRENRIRQGKTWKIAIKPRWNAVAGSRDECGLAINCAGIGCIYGTEGEQRLLNAKSHLGTPLFDLAETGIAAEDPLTRSMGIAALSALSQKFLGCRGIRNRGFLSQCWKTGDEFIRNYPAISHVINLDDTVAVAGYGGQVIPLHNWCRRLHVVHLNLPETFESVVIDKESTNLPTNIEWHPDGSEELVIGRADVVLLSTSTLVDNSFSRLMAAAKNARLIGIYGLGSSLVPDAFFERGIDLFSSFRITEPGPFIVGMENDYDMESSMKAAQKQYLMMRPEADIGSSPITAFLRHADLSGDGKGMPAR
ncbi:MAG: DUF364 domain-containing protein [Methanoregula sp.]|jgi:uncharacterized protein (DUF4213/DUF364 family)